MDSRLRGNDNNMENAVISALFDQMADIMEILGEDRFRINSNRKVARVIGDIPTDVEDLLAGGQLAKDPGIGKSSLAWSVTLYGLIK